MTIKTITFQQTFPTGPYMNQRLGVEIGIDELDIIEPQSDGSTRIYTMEHLAKEAFHRAKAIVDEAFKSMNPSIATDFNTGEQVIVQEQQIDRRIGVLAEDILSSPDLKTLESYKLIVKAKPELQTAYDQRLKELS